MPATRPRAAFEPIAPDLDVNKLVEETPHFQFVDRISCEMIDEQGLDAFDKLVQLHVIHGGKPLVIDNYQSRLDPWTFSSKWLQDNEGGKTEQARDLTKQTNMPLTVGHYMRNMGKLADQFFENSENYKDTKSRQRIYLKDIDCPTVWADKLRDQLPPNLFYLNENTGEYGGPGSVDEPGPTGGRRKGRGIAPAGDLMSSLPGPMRAENLMCYIGHEGTYTPAHKEMCGSLGHNIMVETSETVGEDGKPEKPGSSIWFMTETKERDIVSEYWLSVLGHDIEVEKHFAQIAAWKKAPFTVYVVDQRAGDFILIPPLAPHQVWNRGTRTMKVAWNRTTVDTLDLAMKVALPNARLVCREEQYKNKAIIYYTLQKYSTLLTKAKDQQQTAPSPQEASALRSALKIRHLSKEFKKLFNMFKGIMLSEMFSPENPHEKNVQFFPFDSNITCAYCRGNIFNRFLTCPGCEHALGTPEAEPYDVCMDCFVMGRSCACIAKFRWAEQFKWKELQHKYETWRRQYLEVVRGASERTPLTLSEERAHMEEKTLAQICQEQLKVRPKVDARKPQSDPNAEPESEEEIIVDDNGLVKKTKKKRSEAWLKNNWACHHCCHRHEKWKMMPCECGRKWCFGTLFRGYDLMPEQVLKTPNWKCPHCRGICNAGSCKKDPRQEGYEPKGTVLGHDTKAVADVRSVESLVDFGVSNLSWLKESATGATDSNRLVRRALEAQLEKANEPVMVEEYDADNNPIDPALGGTLEGIEYENTLIDPALQQTGDPSMFAAPARADGYAPAQSQTVAPTAVMFHPPQDNDDDSFYPDAEGDPDESHQVRKRALEALESSEAIKRQPAKRQRISEANGVPVTGASKQFQRERERKALEVAKAKGRYIMVSAAMKGKSKVVKLKLGPELMTQVTADPAHEKVLLQSDIAPAPASLPVRANGHAKQNSDGKSSKAVRIRVEEDEDFGTRRRRPTKKATLNAKGRRISKGYEEVDLDSPSEDDNHDEDDTTAGHLERGPGGTKRRRSAWQEQRHGDGDQELDELPENWKDGRRALRETHNSSQQQQTKVSGKSVPGLRPPGHSGRVDEFSEDDEDDENQEVTQSAAAAMAVMQEEENRIAKLAALEESEEDSEADDEPSYVKPVSSSFTALNSRSPAAGMSSIMSKRGPGGRKVKIVSGKKKQNS